MQSRALLVAVAFALAAPAAQAQSPEDQAEKVRLVEDMKRLARRNAWRGVDEAYLKLLALQARGVALDNADHELGADAATALGDISSAYDRLKRASNMRASDEVKQRIAAIEADFGSVKLVAEPKYIGTWELSAAQMPFAADQRNAISKAQGALAAGRSYEGLLPYGAYTFGPKSFEVKPGAGLTTVTLGQEDGVQKERGVAYIGPRIDLGPAFTVVGAPSADAGIQPDGFSGAGGRLGVGLQLGMHSGFGGLVQVGYHGLFGGREEGTEAFETTGSSLQMGFAWLAGSWRRGGLDLSLGPVFAFGAARTTGLAEGAVFEGQEYQALKGSVMSTGGSLGLSYVFMDLGSMKAGVGLQGGAQLDGARMYPWGQLGLTVAPVRREG